MNIVIWIIFISFFLIFKLQIQTRDEKKKKKSSIMFFELKSRYKGNKERGEI